MLRSRKQTFTPAEYLAMEAAAEYKSEYYNGEIFAMSGGTADHSSIAVNLTIELGTRLSAKPCRVFNSDMRLHVERSGLFTYPDVMVVCGKIEFIPRRQDVLTNPGLIVEALSESTREYDRGTKLNFYKEIPSLREYVMVESEQARVECYRRSASDQWRIETYDNLNAVAGLESVDCKIPLRQIYAKVSWVN